MKNERQLAAAVLAAKEDLGKAQAALQDRETLYWQGRCTELEVASAIAHTEARHLVLDTLTWVLEG